VSDNASELEYVGFWARVGASLIDTVLMLFITIPLLLAIYGGAYWEREATSLFGEPAEIIISYLLPAVVIILLWIKISTTPGKMALGAFIVDARTGGRPTPGQLVLRYIGYYLSTIPLLLGLIWVGIDPRKQGWHDKIAGTVVVRRKGGTTEPVRFDKQPG